MLDGVDAARLSRQNFLVILGDVTGRDDATSERRTCAYPVATDEYVRVRACVRANSVNSSSSG
jgi:hypothetical protein